MSTKGTNQKAARSASATKSNGKSTPAKPTKGAKTQQKAAKVTFTDISVIIRADHVLENLDASRLAFAHGMRSASATIVKDLAPCKLLDAGRKSIPAEARETLNRYAEAYGADTQQPGPLSQAIRARIRRLYRVALVASAHHATVSALDAATQLRWFMSTRTACANATEEQFNDMLKTYRSDYATFLTAGKKTRATKGPKVGGKGGGKGGTGNGGGSATPPATPPAPGSESATPPASSVPATPPADPREAAIKAQGAAHNALIDALAQYIATSATCHDLGIEPMSKTARTALEVRMRNVLDMVINPKVKPVAKGKGKKTA